MRAIRIYSVFLKQYLKKLMEYRADFFVGMLSFFVMQASNLFFISMIFKRITSLNGWSYHQVLFIYGFSQIPRGLDHLLTDNLWLLANTYVRDGTFDKYLLRPINPLFHLIAERFQPDAFGEILIGICIFSYTYVKLSLSFTLIEWLLCALAVLSGAVIYTSIKLAGASVALWTKRSITLLQIVYQLSEFASYPVSIFSGMIKFLLTWLVPFSFVAFIPASQLLGNAYITGGILFGCLVAICTWLISYHLIWKRGLKVYESAGN